MTPNTASPTLKSVTPAPSAADHAREIAAENVREFQVAGAAIGAAAEPHLVIGGVDAGGVDIDHDLAGPGHRVRQIAVDEFIDPAMAGQIGRFHILFPLRGHREAERRSDLAGRRAAAREIASSLRSSQ